MYAAKHRHCQKLGYTLGGRQSNFISGTASRINRIILRSGMSKPGQSKPEESKLKVLALHGYRQNGDSFKGKLGSFRKFVGKYAEFVFVSAPHVAAPIADGEEKDPSQRSWWFNKEDGTFKGTNRCGPAFGFDESLKLLEKVWDSEKCNGLLGFSQGACFVGLLCDLSARGMTTIKPEFAVLSSGFRSGSLVHMNYYEEQIQIPSLHIYGESDEIISKDMSVALMQSFYKPQVMTHPGGHYFPAQANLKQTYVDFFMEQLQINLETNELRNAVAENFMLLDDPRLKAGIADDSDDSD